jgi:WD40 repeat protein
VSRNRTLDYRTIVAPKFICNEGISSLLANKSEGDLTAPGEAIYREIYNSKVGDLTLVFHIVDARRTDIGLEDDGILKDEFGREISLTVGIVLRKISSIVNFVDKDIEEAHKQIVRYYYDFWNCTTSQPVFASDSFEIGKNNSSGQKLELKIMKPLTLKSKEYQTPAKVTSYPKQESSNLWNCVHTLPAGGAVSSVAFSPNGNIIAAKKYDFTGIVWDLSQLEEIESFGKQIKICGVPYCKPSSVAFNPDGKLLASSFIQGVDENVIKIWNLWEEEEEKKLFGHMLSELGRIYVVVFSPNGKILASGGEDKVVKLWDVKAGLEITTLEGHSRAIKSIAFSPDGQKLASADSVGVIKLWNLRTQREIYTIKFDFSGVNSIYFSPDSKILASGNSDGSINLLNVETGKKNYTINNAQKKEINSVVFSPDGQTIASGSNDKKIKLWDVKTGENVHTLLEHKGWVTSVAFSRDGKMLASGSTDKTIKIWQMR